MRWPVSGGLSSACAGAYNTYAGPQQRCWVQLLRDLHRLKEQHAQEPAVAQWAHDERTVYDPAQALLQASSPPTQEARAEQYSDLVERVCVVGRQYAQRPEHPCRALAQRLVRHQDEVFQCVLVDGLSADHNLAERSLRPLVVMRKVSGGTRSPQGRQTRMALASLFGTWQARDQNPVEACLKLLSQIALPQI